MPLLTAYQILLLFIVDGGVRIIITQKSAFHIYYTISFCCVSYDYAKLIFLEVSFRCFV